MGVQCHLKLPEGTQTVPRQISTDLSFKTLACWLEVDVQEQGKHVRCAHSLGLNAWELGDLQVLGRLRRRQIYNQARMKAEDEISNGCS